MPSPLHLDVLVAPYKPIVGLIPPMSAGEATWPATSVSLIAGERDAVLVDAALTPEDAEQIVKWIGAAGKNLTTIYITHGHADHFFGLNTILGAFPRARAVTAATVVPAAKGQLSAQTHVTTTRPPSSAAPRPTSAISNTLSGSHSAQELVDKMMVLHGDRGNPYTLWTAVRGVFEQGQGASS